LQAITHVIGKNVQFPAQYELASHCRLSQLPLTPVVIFLKSLEFSLVVFPLQRLSFTDDCVYILIVQCTVSMQKRSLTPTN